MDVDFISKDGVALPQHKGLRSILKILHLLHFLVIWKYVCQILGLWRGPSVCIMYLEAVAATTALL